jgi:hypothetical protein
MSKTLPLSIERQFDKGRPCILESAERLPIVGHVLQLSNREEGVPGRSREVSKTTCLRLGLGS